MRGEDGLLSVSFSARKNTPTFGTLFFGEQEFGSRLKRTVSDFS
jgi:hypothetical protein